MICFSVSERIANAPTTTPADCHTTKMWVLMSLNIWSYILSRNSLRGPSGPCAVRSSRTVVVPDLVDFLDRSLQTAPITTHRMRPKSFAIEVVPERRVQRKPVAVEAHDRHSVRQPSLDIWPANDQMDRALKELWIERRAAVPRRNAVADHEM